MLKLYEIEQSYLAALDIFTDPENEIMPEVAADTLEAIEGEFELKAVRVAAFAKQMEAEADAIKAAIEGMDKRRKALENRAKWLKDYVKQGMETLGFKKLESPWFVASVQKNPASVDILNAEAIPSEFKHNVIEIRIDKAAIKTALASGQNVPGAKLTNGTRLAIK
jgi:Siphovirus Gp157.